jgi:hypothetical protein
MRDGLFAGFYNEKEYECPICRFGYVHIIDVELFGGKDDYFSEGSLTIKSLNDIKRDNTEIPTCNRIRNLAIKINLRCESGHHWSENYVGHKGMLNRYIERNLEKEDEWERGLKEESKKIEDILAKK